MRKALKIILVILAVIVLLAIACAIFIWQTGKNFETLSDLPIEDVNLSTVPDGTYKGSYSAFPVAAEVEVTVQGGKIAAIDLIKHSNGQGKAAEAITGMVVQAQSLKVDAISGATYSSKVIVLAIKDALTSAAERQINRDQDNLRNPEMLKPARV